MNIETEKLKLKLIETQMLVLQYQHKEVTENINLVEVKKKFDASVDSHDIPTGAQRQPDKYTGT